MKKEATKKSKLGIILIAGIALLLVAAGVVGFMMFGSADSDVAADPTATGPQGPRADLYWNLDRKFYTENSLSGLSTREPGEDGVYRVRYAYNGQVLELPVSDKQLINYIDTMDCMGIVQDADGVVIDVVDPKTLATETARMFYVRNTEGDKIILNSSMAMNGMAMEVQMGEYTEIYDVAPTAENPGAKIDISELEPMDAVTVYANAEGQPTHVFLVTHPVESPVYWRAEQFYNSTEKSTTRVPDAEGYYTIGFYVEGEYVELKCNNVGIVNTIDSKNRYKAHTGLVLDENGNIVDNMLAATGIRGLLACEMYDVTEINGNTFTAEALLAGSGDTYTGTLNADCKIYDVSLTADPEVRGKQITELKLGDRVAVFEDANGGVQLIYVAHRLCDSPMYFNVTKQYDSSKKSTKRTPDANGWYTIELMSEGVIKTYKTQDKAIMDKIDSQNNRSVGLRLNGDIIERVYEGECVAGYGAMVGYTIKNITGSILSMAPSTNPDNVSNRILHADAKVYNMSGVKQEKGATTTLQIGDYCIMWRNPRSEVVYAYVVKRLVKAPVYFSITRKWDSTTKSTTRVPDADGWYIYECLCDGKEVTVKTQSKKVADFLDSQSPQTFALHTNSDGVILDYFETINVYGGSKSYLNTYVKRLDKLVLYNPTNDKTYTPKLAKDCVIYNMSSVYDSHRGERTTLRMNDRIQCYTNMQGEIAMIMVRERKAEGEIYFSRERMKPVDGQPTRVPDADGWYIFECAKDGQIVTVKTQDVKVAVMLDSQSPRGFALQVDADGVIKKAYAATAVLGGGTAALNQDITAIDGKTIYTHYTVDGGDRTFQLASNCKVYNVSGNYEDHWGETTTLKVGDQLQCYTNQSGQIVIAYVTIRPAESYMGWNVDPQYDSTNRISKRQPDADGLFTVDLAVNGQINTYKVEGQKVINYIDSANGAVAISLRKGIIINAQSAIYGPGVWTSTDAAVIATIQSVGENTVNIKNSKGETVDLTLASEFVCYDVTGNGAFKGVAATPAVGDYGRMYLNTDREVMFFYIMPSSGSVTPDPDPEPELPEVPVYDNSDLVFAEGTTKATCTYCNKEVEWIALETITATTNLNAGHYYLAEDITGNTAHYNIVKDETVCVHLNGHNVTSSARVFAVDNGSNTLLNIMGNGTVTGGYKSTSTANVAGATISVRGNLNLIGGTYKHANSTLPTIIMAKPQQSVNIYKDVKIEGTEGTTGTNLYVMMGVVNMYGGEITGGTATPNGTTNGRGDNVYVHGWTGSAKARAEFNIYGGLVDGGIYAEKTTETFVIQVAGDAVITANKGGLTLDAQTNARLTLGALSDNAKIYVSGQGNLTLENAKAQQYLTAGIIAAADSSVELSVLNNVIVATAGEEIPDPDQYVWAMAWVVDPQFDEATTSTTRTPDAEGYYYVQLSIDGITKTYKTKATGLMGQGDGIDYVDQSGSKNRAIAICLKSADSDEFIEAIGATNHTGATGAKVTTITSVENGVITGTNVDYTGKVAETGQVFDVSPDATVEGEITDLKVGDYCRFYVDSEGNILYGYVYTRTTQPETPDEPEPPVATVDMNGVKAAADEMAPILEAANGAEVEAECPACGKTVTWKAIPAISGTTKLESGHYYFASDVNVSAGYYSINGAGLEVCIHLNGKTYQNTGTGNTRSFYVDAGAKVNIMGSGNLIGARGTTTAAERCGSTLEVVGANTIVNVCGGTWSKTKDTLDVIGIRGRENAVVGIYDGTVINIGEVQGNALWVAGGNVNLAGGEINGDVMVRKYVTDTATLHYDINLTLSGTAVNGKVYYRTDNGTEITTTLKDAPVISELVVDSALPIQIGRLELGADVKITAEGTINVMNPNLQDYVDAGFLAAKAEDKIITVTEGVGTIADAPEAKYDNSDLVFEEGTNRAYCTYCGDVKEWTALESTADGAADGLNVDGGHYYLPADYLDNVGRYNVGEVAVCIHLNGHNVTNVSNRAFTIGTAGTATIMGNGIVTGNYNSTTTANVAAATISVRRNVNLIGGTYKAGEASQLPAILMAAATGNVVVEEGVTIEGSEANVGLLMAYGHLTVNGGLIKSMALTGYDTKPTHAQASATLLGGTVEKITVEARDPNGSYKTYMLDLIVGGTAKANVELAQGAKITIHENGMKKGAEITVTAANGAITDENAKAADYLALGYFKPADETKTITEKDGVLSIG